MVGDVENPVNASNKNDEVKVSIEMKSQVTVSEKDDHNVKRIKEYQEELSNFEKLEVVTEITSNIENNEFEALETNIDLSFLIIRKIPKLMMSLTDLAENLYAIINFDKKYRYMNLSLVLSIHFMLSSSNN